MVLSGLDRVWRLVTDLLCSPPPPWVQERLSKEILLNLGVENSGL